MKKNSFVVASVAGLLVLTLASGFTFADTSGYTSGTGSNMHTGYVEGTGHKENKTESGELNEGIEGTGEIHLGTGMLGTGKWEGTGEKHSGSGMRLSQNIGAINTSIINNDYTGYLTAIQGTSKEGKVTQAQFTAMVTKQHQKTAMNTAIANNDYTGYLLAIQGTSKQGKVTLAKFDKLVLKRKQTTAIANNDYTGYLMAIQGTSKQGKVTLAQFDKMVKHMQKTSQ